MVTTTALETEIIHVTSEISIRVIRLGNGKVSIGVTAPKDVPVLRCKVTDQRDVQVRHSVLGLDRDRQFRLRIVGADDEEG